MFRWFCPSTFSLRDTNVTFWPPCSPEHAVWQRVIRGASEFKVRNLIFELAFALVSFRFARYTVLTSPNKDETAVHGYGLTFIGSVVVLVSRKAIFFYVVSALQLCCPVKKRKSENGHYFRVAVTFGWAATFGNC